MEYYLTGFNHQKTLLTYDYQSVDFIRKGMNVEQAVTKVSSPTDVTTLNPKLGH